MATRRLLVFLAGALAIGVGAAWVATDFHPVLPAAQRCLPDVPYAVDVQDDQATFDLPLEAGGCYRIIVASVASQDVESTIRLSANAVPAVERFPLRQVPAVQSAIPRQQQTTWMSRSSSEAQRRSEEFRETSKRVFSLHVTDGPLNDPRQYAQVTALPVAEGRYVRVFLDSQMLAGQLAKNLVSEIVRLFDTEIVPGSRKVLGKFRDVDGDGKFAILISPWLGKLQGGQTSLGGFVRGSDFQNGVNPPFGNQADVMYLNANLQPGSHLKTLLAHEYAHAICFSERLPTKRHPEGLPIEEDWLNEAIAHLAENLHETGWTNLDHRVSRFLDATHHSPLVVRNYYAGGLWRDPGCRGATYLFLRWVVDQFGEEVLTRLIRGHKQGIENLESATGVSFPDLFRGWTIALAQSGREDFPKGPRFGSLNLSGRLGRWSLQGARATNWDLNEPQIFSLTGTSAKVFEVHSDTPGVYRVRVRTQGQPKLQVTVIRLPENGPRPEAFAHWETSNNLSAAYPPALSVRIPSACRIVRLSVECREGARCSSHCWEADQLLLSKNGTVDELTLNPPSRLFPSSPRTTSAKWQLKVLLEDPNGHRSAQWIDLPAPPTASIQLSAVSD